MRPEPGGANPLRTLFRRRFSDFQSAYEQRYAPTYGRFRLPLGRGSTPPLITRAASAFGLCGDWSQSVARIRCSSCGFDRFRPQGEDLRRPFSCKSCFIYSSRAKKRTLRVGEYLSEDRLLPLPRRHDRELFADPGRLLFDILRRFFCQAAGRLLVSSAQRVFIHHVLAAGDPGQYNYSGGDMAELKTRKTDSSVTAFIAGIADESVRADCTTLLRIMRKYVKTPPAMWGPSMVGLGTYHYRYASWREGDWFTVGFSPRKQALTVYLLGGFQDLGTHLAKLGKYKTGKGCLYLRRLADVDLGVLEKMVAATVKKAAMA